MALLGSKVLLLAVTVALLVAVVIPIVSGGSNQANLYYNCGGQCSGGPTGCYNATYFASECNQFLVPGHLYGMLATVNCGVGGAYQIIVFNNTNGCFGTRLAAFLGDDKNCNTYDRTGYFNQAYSVSCISSN